MKILFSLFLLFPLLGKGAVYDCFLFFNELEILDIRLRELYDSVDYFVLIESTETFRGNVKPLYYYENRERFLPYQNKIIHVIVTERIVGDNPWAREAYQRNQIMRGLSLCQEEDIIIISDVDEIIRSTNLSSLLAPLADNEQIAVTAQLRFFSKRLNRLNPDFNSTWNGPVATKFKYLRISSPQRIRDRKDSNYTLCNSGWHFTSVGTPEQMIAKIESYSHQEDDRPENKIPSVIVENIKKLQLVPIDSSFPLLVQEKKEYFQQIGLIDY